jgi:hypothetical protein
MGDTKIMCDQEEYKALKERNKYLEELCYNTKKNGGISISDEIKEINQKDELIALRNEFKNLVQVNSDLRKKLQPSTPCCYYCCILL